MSSPVAPPEDGAPPGVVEIAAFQRHVSEHLGDPKNCAFCAQRLRNNNAVVLGSHNPDTEALATLKEAVKLHILNVDICDNQAARVSLSRLRSLVSINLNSVESSLIEGERRGPSIGGLCVEEADTKCPREDHREFHCCVRPFGHAEKQHECKCGAQWPLIEGEKPR